MQNGIVRDDNNIVLRYRNIQFQRVYALLDGVAECIESILRPAGAGAAVSMNKDRFQCTVLVLRFM
jgi:hypothetical protein